MEIVQFAIWDNGLLTPGKMDNARNVIHQEIQQY
ncbi:unnamed protein product [Paramecium primaurelia]|uniref:Uncharacterized protein n=1 Tax=Paramecium primaurelia TaxID=5886 RepID=A0A8S1QDD8_PARPR|nr:unnamed protein product [Paramecium primaurelia]